MDLGGLGFPTSNLNQSTIDTFVGIDHIPGLSTADISAVQSISNNRTNIQMENIAAITLCSNKLPNCMPRSDISINVTNISNCEIKTNISENKMFNNELSSAICLQQTNYSSIESEPSNNVNKTNLNVKIKADGIQTQKSLPITSGVETISQNSSINENVTRMETSSEIDKPESERISLEYMNSEEIMQLNKEKTLAIRSLQTNLLLIGVVIMMSVLYLVPSPAWQFFFTNANESLQKVLLPTLSTIANFGTIRSVAMQYWKYSNYKIHRNLISPVHSGPE